MIKIISNAKAFIMNAKKAKRRNKLYDLIKGPFKGHKVRCAVLYIIRSL